MQSAEAAMMNQRTVFFVSDQTGVTAETLGHSLLTQFDGQHFRQVTVPFISNLDKAREAVRKINLTAEIEGTRPIVFSTLVQDDIRREVQESVGLFLDFFDAFLAPLERELAVKSTHTTGRAHGMADLKAYTLRIEATNFALANDDGTTTRNYDQADVILLGVSRTGKTPTCLYLALQYGIFAANYPLADEEFEKGKLPASLEQQRDKLYGLTIAPARLEQIRRERRPDGRYASPQQVGYELRESVKIFNRYAIPYVDTTQCSIEEIASTILDKTGVERRLRP
ncbi:pyruvate, water dikinase regulatory protein [soil metagenome]